MRKRLISGKYCHWSKLPVILFFIGFLSIGLFLVDDYGIHWDDHSQYNHGLVNVGYIRDMVGREPVDSSQAGIQLAEYKDRTHGVVFQVFAMSLQQLLGFEDPRDCFLLRHYLTFMIFFTGLIFFYRLIREQFNSTLLAMLGVVMMILSPRIFADSFYNSKDIVFLSLTIINSWTLVRFIQKPTIKTASFHAIAGAFLIATRIIGIFMPAVTALFFVFKMIERKRKSSPDDSYDNTGSPGRLILPAACYFALTFLLTVGFWPYLWEDPLRRLMEVFTAMSHFNWDDPVLFRSRFLIPDELPFYYIPFWIVITTPLLYSILFLFGLGFVFRKHRQSSPLIVKVSVILFFFPLLTVILLGSVVYDGWRQMFFLYVPFMILAIAGLGNINDFLTGRLNPKLSQRLSILLYALIIISSTNTAIFMIRYHPHQNVYFNCLAGHETTRDFEADYWGLSYKQVIQHLLEEYPGDTLSILSVNWPGQANADILPAEMRGRLRFTGSDSANFYISNYRFPTEHDKFFRREFPYDQPIYEIEVKGNKIAGVYRWIR